jgi:beta-fructofuranosidase
MKRTVMLIGWLMTAVVSRASVIISTDDFSGGTIGNELDGVAVQSGSGTWTKSYSDGSAGSMGPLAFSPEGVRVLCGRTGGNGAICDDYSAYTSLQISTVFSAGSGKTNNPTVVLGFYETINKGYLSNISVDDVVSCRFVAEGRSEGMLIWKIIDEGEEKESSYTGNPVPFAPNDVVRLTLSYNLQTGAVAAEAYNLTQDSLINAGTASVAGIGGFNYAGMGVTGLTADAPDPFYFESLQVKGDEGSLPTPPRSEMLQIQQSRDSLADDPFRPLYHLSSPFKKQWDPGGFCEWNGKYHLFYISQGGKGHAVSEDMVHWQDLPKIPALGGMTGQMITTGNQALMTVFSGSGLQLASSTDPMLLNWEKHTALPVSQLDGYQQPIDSCIWEEDDTYFIGVRKQRWDRGLYHLRGDPPELAVFRSSDLKSWEYDGQLLRENNYTQTGDDFACPNFLPIGHDRHLLLWFCHPRGAMYLIGAYDKEKQEQKFSPEFYGRLSYGPVLLGTLHAPSAFVDSAGRCFTIFNVSENRPHRGEWIGTMSLPRQISLQEDYLENLTSQKPRNFFSPLRIEPPAALETLRFDPVEINALDIPANDEVVLSGVQGKAIEIDAVMDPKNAREVGFRVLRSPDGKEQTTIRFYMNGWGRADAARNLSIDVSESSLAPDVKARIPEMGPLYLEDGEPLRLRVFVDRSIIEVFANDRQCLTIRAYPTRDDSSQVSVFARGSGAKLVSLRAWQMRSIWPELKAREGN